MLKQKTKKEQKEKAELKARIKELFISINIGSTKKAQLELSKIMKKDERKYFLLYMLENQPKLMILENIQELIKLRSLTEEQTSSIFVIANELVFEPPLIKVWFDKVVVKRVKIVLKKFTDDEDSMLLDNVKELFLYGNLEGMMRGNVNRLYFKLDGSVKWLVKNVDYYK